MRYGPLLLLTSALAVSAGAVRAQPTAPMATSLAARPAREGVTYFSGTWRVTTREPRGGPESAVRYRVEPVLGGVWLIGSASSSDPTLAARDVWGVDPLSGEIMRTIYDVSGTHAVVRSAGWNGDTLVLEGDARSSGGVVHVRETITRLGPGAFSAVWEAQRNGAWSAYAVERAERA